MILDLNPLPYRMAFDIIRFCIEHDIDREKCVRMIEACSEVPCPDIEWEIDIPEKYVDWILLKWSN